jgi:hypothetical protein
MLAKPPWGMSNLNEWALARKIMSIAVRATPWHSAAGCRVLRRLESKCPVVSEQLADQASRLVHRAVDVLTGERAFDGAA